MQEDIIAVFPLPNVVFFPKTDLPLHIFESRYCEMIKDTLKNKQLIGMFLLQPGWQNDYFGNPPVYTVGCAGELVRVEKLPDEKYNILLRGLYRVKAIEMVQEYPYRRARVQVLPDTCTRDEGKIEVLKGALVRDFDSLALQARSSELPVFEKPADFAEIVNTLATTLQLDVDMKMHLLEENDVYKRAKNLHHLVKRQLSIFRWTNQFDHLRPSDPNLN